jgi:tRNA(fMet)-specific endonuclease VapC
VREVRAARAFRVTSVSAFELALGRDYARNPAPVDALLSTTCLVLTRRAALRGGDVLRGLRTVGAGIEIRDAMQAGICLEARAPLVTRNVRHFTRVPGLEVVEPQHWLDDRRIAE